MEVAAHQRATRVSALRRAKNMNIFFAIFRIFCLLPCVVHAENKMPPEVRRVLEQIQKTKAGDTLGSFLSDAKIKAEAKEIDGVGGHKCYFLTWTIEDSGHWLMFTTSRQVPNGGDDRSDGQWSDRRNRGELISVSVYFRDNVSEALDFQKHKRQFPYFSGRKVHTKLEAEPVGTEKTATRSESKSEGGDKPQPESEGCSR